MQDQLNTVIRQLFQKNSLGDVSEQTLRDFTEKYPYSPIGQLLLAKKLKQNKTDGFEEQAAKSVLYFNNPLWFDWLISMEHVRDNDNDEQISDTPPPTDPLIAEAIPEEETIQEEKADEILSEKDPEEETNDVIEEEVEEIVILAEEFDDEIIENTGFIPAEPKQSGADDSHNMEEHVEEKPLTDSGSSKYVNKETWVHDTNEQVGNAVAESGKEGTNSFDDELIENTGFIPEERKEEEREEPASELRNETVARYGDNGHAEEQRTEIKKDESESFDDELNENTGFVAEEQDQPQSELSTPVPSDLIEKGPEVVEKTASKDDLSFEPYHTIDYFASQGIKLKQEDLEKDKFGKQLKSFTDWLRSMKKIPGSKSPQSLEVEPGDSATIRRKADESIEGKEIETETMAEVWAKQGNISKAISIYEKLSLSNPDKSHYFAAKIEQLKAN